LWSSRSGALQILDSSLMRCSIVQAPAASCHVSLAQREEIPRSLPGKVAASVCCHFICKAVLPPVVTPSLAEKGLPPPMAGINFVKILLLMLSQLSVLSAAEAEPESSVLKEKIHPSAGQPPCQHLWASECSAARKNNTCRRILQSLVR